VLSLGVNKNNGICEENGEFICTNYANNLPIADSGKRILNITIKMDEVPLKYTLSNLARFNLIKNYYIDYFTPKNSITINPYDLLRL
jgi:hypothetical protein